MERLLHLSVLAAKLEAARAAVEDEVRRRRKEREWEKKGEEPVPGEI